MTPQEFAPYLDAAAGLGESIATALPQPYQSVVHFVLAAVHFGADLARNGIDPLRHIERMHAAAPELAETESDWQKALRAKFPDAG